MPMTHDQSPRLDLHLHSTASDGTLSPTDVVKLAAQTKLQIIALTDHDTTQGIDEALAAGDAAGVEVIPGVELSTSVDAGELHMLGYLIDFHQSSLVKRLAQFQEARRGRADQIVEKLNAIGVRLDLDRVRELAGEGSIGRAHVARALVEAGHVASMDEAFERYLSRGRAGYVARPRLSPVEAVELVHASGGVAVLAHPFSVADLDTTLARLVGAGLDGIEVFYSLYNDEQRHALANLAERFDLVPTGGSDFHGPGEREGREIGTAPVPSGTADRLRDAQRAR